MDVANRRQRSSRTVAAAGLLPRAAPGCRRSTPALAELQGQPARLLVACGSFSSCSSSACSPSSSPTTSRSSSTTRAIITCRCFAAIPETEFGGIFETEADLSRPRGQGDDQGDDGWIALAADPVLLRHPEQEPADGVSGEANLDADQADCELAIKRGSIPATPSSNGTGSAPTTRAATSSPA